MTLDEMLAREGIRQTMAAYTAAGDRLREDEFIAVFTEDAVLESEGVPERDLFRYAGREAIREWAGREIIGDRVTMFVATTVSRGDHITLTAHMDSDYDKTGLPDPLTLTFYFSVRNERIVQLIILHNRPAV